MNLKNAGGQLRTLLRDVPVGITVLRGADFMVETATAAYLEIVDRKEEDFVGKRLFESLPELRERIEPLLVSVYKTSVPYHGHEFQVTLNRHGKNDTCYLNFVCAPIFEADGSTSGIVVVTNDVTSGVIARQRLEESELKFRNLFMQSHIAKAIFLGEDMVIDIANKSLVENIWRRKKEDVINKKLLDIFPEMKDQKFPALLQKVYKNGTAYSENEAPIFVDGADGMRNFYLDLRYEPLFDPDHVVFGILVTLTDVTERVTARKQLEEAEEKTRLAIASAKLGAYEIDLANDNAHFSQRLLEIFGFDHPVSRAMIATRIEEEDLEIRDRAHEEAIRTGHLRYEIRVHPTPDQTTWIRAEGTILHDKEGKPTTLVGIIRDITEEKMFAKELERQVQQRTEQLQAANEEIAATNEELVAANEEIAATNEELTQTNSQLLNSNFELEQFNYAASHDLQEPVRKIQTFASFLITEGENASKEKVADFLKRIYTSADRMKELIDDLLMYARDSSAEKQVIPVDLNSVLEGVVSDLDLIIEQKSATIDLGPLPTLQAIPGQMHQLFRNLLSNSLKFARQNVEPKIIIRATRERDKAHITFEDNGIGFQQEFADYVFKLFKRLHSKSDYDGTGIGLALCKKIVENHGGNIYAVSQQGQGTTMHIILPLYNSTD